MQRNNEYSETLWPTMHMKYFIRPQSADVYFNDDFRIISHFTDSVLWLQRCISLYSDNFTKACKFRIINSDYSKI